MYNFENDFSSGFYGIWSLEQCRAGLENCGNYVRLSASDPFPIKIIYQLLVRTQFRYAYIVVWKRICGVFSLYFGLWRWNWEKELAGSSWKVVGTTVGDFFLLKSKVKFSRKQNYEMAFEELWGLKRLSYLCLHVLRVRRAKRGEGRLQPAQWPKCSFKLLSH